MNPPAITRPGPSASGRPPVRARVGTPWVGSLLIGLWLATAPGLGSAAAAPDDAGRATVPAPSQADTPVTPEPARDEASTASENSPDAKAESPDVFVPSEDISEDFAVSFPVDI